MTPNCLIASSDVVQYGSVNVTCLDTSITPAITAGFPLSNLLTPDLYQGTQFATNALTNTQFVIDLGSQQPISFLALLKHNANSGAYWSVKIYDTLANYQTSTALYSSGSVPMVPSATVFGTLAWGLFDWGETTSEADLSGYNRNAYMPLNNIVLGRYISVTIQADTNTAPLMAYRFWASTYYQPSFNLDYGSELEPIDETVIKKGYTGARTYGQTVKRRQLKANFSTLPQAEMLANIYTPLFLRNGVKTPFIFMISPQDSTMWMATTIFGNLQPQNPNALPFVSWNHMGSTFIIEEAV